MGAAEFHLLQIAIGDQDFFLVDGGALHDLAIGGGDETIGPRIRFRLRSRACRPVREFFRADAVGAQT